MLNILTESNKELNNRYFPLPEKVREYLQNILNNYKGDKTIDGYKRLNNILSMDTISYHELKRIKNFFDHYSGTDKSAEYILNGGEVMCAWVNNTLNTATKAIEDFKQAKKDAGMSNAFRKTHEKDRQNKKKQKPTVSKFKTSNRNLMNNDMIKYESKERVIIISEEQERKLMEAMREETSDNLTSVINKYLNDVNDYVKPFGLTVSFNSNYSFKGYSEHFLAVYQAGSALTGKIRLGINLPYLKTCMVNNRMPLDELEEQINISIWHETGHGLVQFIKRLKRRDTQNKTGLFTKEMKKDFKYITNNEEEVVEEFGAMQEGYSGYSDLDEFITTYQENLIKMLSLKSIQTSYM